MVGVLHLSTLFIVVFFFLNIIGFFFTILLILGKLCLKLAWYFIWPFGKSVEKVNIQICQLKLLLLVFFFFQTTNNVMILGQWQNEGPNCDTIKVGGRCWRRGQWWQQGPCTGQWHDTTAGVFTGHCGIPCPTTTGQNNFKALGERTRTALIFNKVFRNDRRCPLVRFYGIAKPWPTWGTKQDDHNSWKLIKHIQKDCLSDRIIKPSFCPPLQCRVSTYIWLILCYPVLAVVHSLASVLSWILIFTIPVSKMNARTLATVLLMAPEDVQIRKLEKVVFHH